MADWTSSMRQTFEFYKVDPRSWENSERLMTITSCTIAWDMTQETLGSASIECTSDIEECYVRIYLVIIQNGITEKFPLGTFLVQPPSYSFNGKTFQYTMDGYTPLIELKETPPPIGFTLLKDLNIMERAYALSNEHTRAPVVYSRSGETLKADFTANTNDTWLTYLSDLITNADCVFDIDPMGRILFSPIQDTASLMPIYEFNDGNSSILLPDISDDRDLYGIPNVVEIYYATNTGIIYSRVVNDLYESPISTVRRGREIIYRDTAPSFPGVPTQEMVDEYAEKTLRNLSSMEHRITFSHGYCGVRVGDCVRLNYKRAGLDGIKARIISQSIKCNTGCQVESTAVYTTELWRKER